MLQTATTFDSDNAPAKKEVRDEMANEVFQSLSKKMLKELRDQAMIEYPKTN